MSNPVIDLIIRIKNGYMARRETITSPFSKFREQVLKKLKVLGYVKSYEVEGESKKKMIIELIYIDGVPAVTDVRIMSRAGRRMYIVAGDLKPVVNNFGYSILSTPKGIRTNKEAKKENIGGELLFEIW